MGGEGKEPTRRNTELRAMLRAILSFKTNGSFCSFRIMYTPRSKRKREYKTVDPARDSVRLSLREQDKVDLLIHEHIMRECYDILAYLMLLDQVCIHSAHVLTI